MLDIRPVDVASGEREVCGNRLAPIVRIADDEASDDEHAVAMQMVDRCRSGIGRVPHGAGCSWRAFRNARSSSRMFSMPRKTYRNPASRISGASVSPCVAIEAVIACTK